MKRILISIILIAFVLITACSENDSRTQNNQDDHSSDVTLDTNSVADPNTQYIRTGVYRYRDEENPLPVIISSLDELYGFYQGNKQIIGLWHQDDLYFDLTIGFIDAAEKYDEQFFEENALVFVYKIQPSGSIRHHVNSVMVEDNVLYVDIDVLQPEVGNDEMGEWILITEIPKLFAQADSVEVRCKDVDWTPVYNTDMSKDVEFVSDGIAVKPYEQTIWYEGYEEDGSGYSVDYVVAPLEESLANIPELVLGKELSLVLAQRCRMPENYVVYNEQMEQIATPKELSVGTITRFGSGTYYLSVEIRQSGEFNEDIDASDHFEKIYYMKLVVPEKDYGMAEQLSEVGGFEWSDIDRITVECTANDEEGEHVVIEWDDGLEGVSRMVSFLREQGMLVEQQLPSFDDWERRIVFYKDSEDIMYVYTFDYGLYIVTEEAEYAFKSPPWLFEMMIEAAADGSIISFNDAVQIAKKRIVGSSYEQLIDEQSLVYGSLHRDGYRSIKWVIKFKPKEGSKTGFIVEIDSYN